MNEQIMTAQQAARAYYEASEAFDAAKEALIELQNKYYGEEE